MKAGTIVQCETYLCCVHTVCSSCTHQRCALVRAHTIHIGIRCDMGLNKSVQSYYVGCMDYRQHTQHESANLSANLYVGAGAKQHLSGENFLIHCCTMQCSVSIVILLVNMPFK